MKKKNRTKYSKYKNTGVLFELLVRQITNDILRGLKKSPASIIIENFFNKKTIIRKEMNLYHTLQNNSFNTEEKANRFIDAVCEEFKKINKSALRNEKYNLIKEIKKNYNLIDFFKVKIQNYKLNASIAKILDGSSSNPADRIRSRYTIVESITGKKISKDTLKSEVLREYKKQDIDLRTLSYKILLEKFNSKYGKLTIKQKKLLREYINNVTNSDKLKEYTDKEINKIGKNLKLISKSVKNKIVKIKINEVISQILEIKTSKQIKDVHMISLLRSYNLLKELKNVVK